MGELKFKDDEKLILRIGKLNLGGRLGECLVSVHSSEDDTAHFHISNDENDIKICIFENKYFGDDNYKLDNSELDNLQSFLKGTNDNMPELYEYRKISIWDRIKSAWEFENNYYSDYKEKDNIDNYTQPDYTKMEEK